ncbi:hypothetical protein E2C01_047550 [Portunus trituberculatus]|uniref:RNase H type-1 domain-containing protein n=1 Tax=Portunus trituberculatus TaxID=210409 RepID=A0A5B7G3X6_PORTR|nr:hypothetical protein [Portunus trituberculatus]
MLCMDSDSLLKGLLTLLYHDPQTPTTSYLRMILGVLTSVGVAKACINVIMSRDITCLQSSDSYNFIPKDDLGSTDKCRSGCGLFICGYISANHYTDTEVSRWLPADMSSTRAEQNAALEALHIVAPLHKNVYFFVDSQASLCTLQSISPVDCELVNKCLDLIHALEGAGATVHFTWIPSHVDVGLHEKTDLVDTVDPWH